MLPLSLLWSSSSLVNRCCLLVPNHTSTFLSLGSTHRSTSQNQSPCYFASRLISISALFSCFFFRQCSSYSSPSQGMPFRTSHDVVGKAVAIAVSKRVELGALSLEELRAIHPIFEDDVYSFLGVDNSIAKFRSYGSTGAACVNEQLAYWKDRLAL